MGGLKEAGHKTSPNRWLAALLRRTALRNGRDVRAASELIANRLGEEPELTQWYETLTDGDARMHFGADEVIGSEHLRTGVRLFHAWRVNAVRERLGSRLPSATMLDVGDTDGLMLKHLGQAGVGLNLSRVAVENIRGNGIEAVLGDGMRIPFDDDHFDCVLCFETLEHVEAPITLLDELNRVLSPDGVIFLSIPWVPTTRVQPRDFSIDRGYGHIHEFSEADFRALLTHTQLELSWHTTCEMVGAPQSLSQRAVLAANAGSHLLCGSFRRFQFYELVPREAGPAAAGAAE